MKFVVCFVKECRPGSAVRTGGYTKMVLLVRIILLKWFQAVKESKGPGRSERVP